MSDTDQERWKYINWVDGIPHDKYKISDRGRLFNCYTGNILGSWYDKSGDRVVSILTDSDCKRIALRARKQILTRFIYIDRTVAIAFIYKPKELNRYRVEHLDGDPMNCEYTNLLWYEWHPHKEELPKLYSNRRLSEEDVRTICETLVATKGSIKKAMVLLFDTMPMVSRQQVENIKYKFHYSDISDEYFWYDDRKFIVL